MWADCQVQKKKNSRAFKRTLTYLYLQKLKCPKCNRILGGKATTKKNVKSYFYYYCNDCKIEFKEKLINDYFNQFIFELVEYDEVVNQFFLPMIKQKFDEPKEQLEKEINNQRNKLERIKKAYINGVFELKEYNEEKKIVEKAITELEAKLDTTDSVEELRFTPKDILLTSFSILFARYKGNLETMVRGVKALDSLRGGDKGLNSEGCTHHRQCDDIGTVKIPRWLKEYTGKELIIETSSGTEFPDDLGSYKMIIHCGGCMLNEREMKYRISCAQDQGIPIANYGMVIAYIHGILKRSLSPFPEIEKLL